MDPSGCTIHTGAPIFTLPIVTDAAGATTVPLTLPASTVGFVLDFQFVVFDPFGSLLGNSSTTKGLEVVIGS